MSSTNPFRSASPGQITTESSRDSSGAAQHEYISPHMVQDDSLGLEEEMPPAYTPSADVYHGESTVEVGPRRPFQPPPRPTHRPSYSTPHSLSESTSSRSQPQLQPRPQSQPQQPPWIPTSSSGSSSWSINTYPGQRYERRGGGLVGALVDTVREVVDAVSSAHDQMRVLPQAHTSAYPASYSQSSSSVGSHNTSSHHGSQGQASAASSAQHLSQNQIADDGSPTNIPVPGHPLLNQGKILMYPNKDYFCAKCRNTGYKNFDPSHPCRKCWEKYGRAYVGPLTYTSWGVESASRASRFQRALPRFTPPQASQLSAEPPYSTGWLPYSSPAPLYLCNPVIGIGEYPPVPDAVPVSPGDPRLGGRLCFKCGGTGTLPFFIIDVRPCSVCGGSGRILR